MTFIRLCKFLTIFLLCALFQLEARGGCIRPQQGPPGAPGINAPAPAFLSVFTLDGCQSPGCLGVLPQTAVIFEKIAAGPVGDISYDPTTGTVTFLTTGFFEVTYGVTVDPPPSANLGLQINPAGVYTAIPGFVPGSGLVPGSILNVLNVDLMTKIRVIVQITAVNQTLQLVNVNLPLNNIRFDTQSAGTVLDPILAYLIVNRL